MKGIKLGNKVMPYWALWLFLFIIIFPFKDASIQDSVVPKKDSIVKAETSSITLKKDLVKSNNNEFLVTRVIDGDTIEIETGETVRYIGMNTPETVHPTKPVECFGKEASAKNKELVAGKKVRLVSDVSERDKYGRLLRYVYIGDSFINLELVKEGYAYASAFPPDVKFSDVFLNAQRYAIENKLGLWGSCEDVGEVNASKDAPEKDSGACDIKGNVSKSGEKIYHVKGCDYYDETKIDESKGERWFCSEREALDAGWRKALNCNS